MQLSTNTITILKNYSKISNTILIKEGNVLKTQSQAKDVFASATLEDTFPVDMPLYDLSRFLNVLSMFDKPELDFSQENLVTINNQVRYTFSDSAIVGGVDYSKEIKMSNIVAQFTLKKEQFKRIIDAASVLGVSHISFQSKDGNLVALAYDPSDSIQDTYKLELDEKATQDFVSSFKVDLLKFLDQEYFVSISYATAGKNSISIAKFETTLPVPVVYHAAGSYTK